MDFWGYTPSAVPAVGTSIAIDRNSNWLRNVASASSVTRQESRLLRSEVFSSHIMLGFCLQERNLDCLGRSMASSVLCLWMQSLEAVVLSSAVGTVVRSQSMFPEVPW